MYCSFGLRVLLESNKKGGEWVIARIDETHCLTLPSDMQKQAQLAYDAQFLLASATNTLPSTGVIPREQEAAKVNYDNGKPMTENLRRHLQRCGISLPPTPPKGYRKRFSDFNSGSAEGLFPHCQNCFGPCIKNSFVVFLVDIEGTTTPLTYVRDVMMPLAQRRLPAFIKAKYPSDPEIVDIVKSALVSPTVPQEAKDAIAADVDHAHTVLDETERARDAFIGLVNDAIASRSSSAFAKQIQGKVWQNAERAGELRTQVFDDFYNFLLKVGKPPATGQLDNCMRVVLYSTGSVQSQQLLMRNTRQGDLTPYIAGYVDPTMVGSKISDSSYARIRKHLRAQFGVAEEELIVVFLTDNPNEVSLADTSGAVDLSVLLIRPLNSWVTYDRLISVDAPSICSFSQLLEPKQEVPLAQLVKSIADLL